MDELSEIQRFWGLEASLSGRWSVRARSQVQPGRERFHSSKRDLVKKRKRNL